MNIDKLTYETISKAVDELNKNRSESFEIIEHKFLPAQMMLKQGNKIYYSNQMKAGDVTVITIPEDKSFDPPKIDITY